MTLQSPRSQSFTVAGLAALLACIGLGYAWYTLAGIPSEPPGDGFVAGLTAALGLAIGLTGLFALAEAVTLATVERFGSPTRRGRLLLTAGALAGGVGTVLPLFVELARGPPMGSPLGMVGLRLLPFAFGGWLLLAALGVLCSVLGVAYHLLGRDRGEAGSTAT